MGGSGVVWSIPHKNGVTWNRYTGTLDHHADPYTINSRHTNQPPSSDYTQADFYAIIRINIKLTSGKEAHVRKGNASCLSRIFSGMHVKAQGAHFAKHSTKPNSP